MKIIDYGRDEHRVHLLMLHLVWTPKRRKPVLVGEVAKDCRKIIEAKCKVMAELVEEKAAKIVPVHGKWEVYFLGFSRSGWTSGALAYQEEINHEPIQGENWVSTGMRLITLDEVDRDMAQWTK